MSEMNNEISEMSSSNVTRRRTRSQVWEHYKHIVDQEKAKCIHCGALIGCASGQGTSSMHHHLVRCKKFLYANVEKRQKGALGQLVGVSSSSGPWKFDQESSGKELAMMFILDELPFKLVEREGFR
ncbi:hypothetical protein BT93_B2713 [Corymbia citriodora subsp. variegata]|nr:hypothetical protein BT93_B2713 [Corymbia citriodora subsp. variegata]